MDYFDDIAENMADESVPPFDWDENDEYLEGEDAMEKESLVHDESPQYNTSLIEEASREYVGQWNRLISTTNWEKGRLIHQWRESMILSGAPLQLYSDDAWSRRVGNVSSQHVGRLRRVFDRFAQEYEQYPGLYWSHFHAALDWDDAPVWLEGAVQQRWSVSQMRKQRWVAIGAPPDLKPTDDEVVLSELDEDAVSAFDAQSLAGAQGAAPMPESSSKVHADGVVGSTARGSAPPEGALPSELNGGTLDTVESFEGKHDFSERKDPSGGASHPASAGGASADSFGGSDSREQGGGGSSPPEKVEEEMKSSIAPVRLLEDLPELPDDLSEAFEMFKLAILNHKLANWGQITKEEVLTTLRLLEKLCD
ncbi:MAG: hypothetical protein Q4D38_03965 [Planctomycetia bacterium]|nr:hypothetical protein [Planctomycetia bacterium]